MHNFKGIVLKTWEYSERHVIASLLLENGHKASFIFYGGKGGGKRQSSNILAVGHCLNITLNKSKTNQDLWVAKEWSLHWQHQNIRFKAKAFYYLCFYCEVIHKLSLEADLDQLDEIVEPDPLYRLLGQALKFLDVDDNLEIPHQLNYFLARTINYLGIKPDLSQCFDCQNLLDTSQTMFFSLANSSFYCESCSYTSSDLVELNVSRELFKYLVLISGSNYNKLPELYKAQNRIAPIMFQYICSQFQMSQNEFLTSSFVI